MRQQLSSVVSAIVLALSAQLALSVELAPASASAPLPQNGLVAFSRADLDNGGYGLWLVRPDGSDQRQVTAGFDDHNPSWSPNGQLLAFDRDGSVVVGRPGGAVRIIAADGTQPTWSPDGRQLAFARKGAIFRVSRAGGVANRLTSPPSGCRDEQPAWSPTGERLMFGRRCAGDHSVNLLTVASGQVRGLTGNGVLDRRDVVSSFDWMPDGRHVALTARCVARGRCLPDGLTDVVIVGTGSPAIRRPVTDARAVAARDRPSCHPNQLCWDGYDNVSTSPDGRGFLVHNSTGNVGCLDTTLAPEKLCLLAASLIGQLEASWQPRPA